MAAIDPHDLAGTPAANDLALKTREKLGLTQEAMAALLSVDRRTVIRWEIGGMMDYGAVAMILAAGQAGPKAIEEAQAKAAEQRTEAREKARLRRAPAKRLAAAKRRKAIKQKRASGQRRAVKAGRR